MPYLSIAEKLKQWYHGSLIELLIFINFKIINSPLSFHENVGNVCMYYVGCFSFLILIQLKLWNLAIFDSFSLFFKGEFSSRFLYTFPNSNMKSYLNGLKHAISGKKPIQLLMFNRIFFRSRLKIFWGRKCLLTFNLLSFFQACFCQVNYQNCAYKLSVLFQ